MPPSRVVLGVDPGFANFGWSIARAKGKTIDFVSAGVIRTKKSADKKAILATDDNVARTRYIARELWKIVNAHRPGLICVEAQSWPRDSSTSAKIAFSWGVLVTFAELEEVPMMQISPQRLKQELCWSKMASKNAVRIAVEHLAPNLVPTFTKLGARAEHAVDASAAILACRFGDVFRAFAG